MRYSPTGQFTVVTREVVEGTGRAATTVCSPERASESSCLVPASWRKQERITLVRLQLPVMDISKIFIVSLCLFSSVKLRNIP